jgi:hypothetical protein
MRHFSLTGWSNVDLIELDGTTTMRLTDVSGDVQSLVISGNANADISLEAPVPTGPHAAAMQIIPGDPETKENSNG